MYISRPNTERFNRRWKVIKGKIVIAEVQHLKRGREIIKRLIEITKSILVILRVVRLIIWTEIQTCEIGRKVINWMIEMSSNSKVAKRLRKVIDSVGEEVG